MPASALASRRSRPSGAVWSRISKPRPSSILRSASTTVRLVLSGFDYHVADLPAQPRIRDVYTSLPIQHHSRIRMLAGPGLKDENIAPRFAGISTLRDAQGVS